MAMRRKAWLGLVWAAAFSWSVSACSSGGGGGSLASLGVDDGASKGVSKSVQVSGDDDVRIALETGALVDVPAGAVKDVKLSIERPSDNKALELVEKFKKDQDRIVSAPYVLTPHGTKFKEEVTVTLPLAKQPKGGEVQVAWLEDEDDTEWKLLGTAKTNGKKAQITVKHFSVLVVVEDASDLEPVEDLDEPAGDASATADAGEPARDAAVPPVVDASTVDANPLDAGDLFDAGEPLDASDSIPDARGGLDAGVNDAGSSTSEAAVVVEAAVPDAAVATDAGEFDKDATPVSDSGAVTSDGGVVPPVDAGIDAGPLLGEQYARLMACNAIALQGQFSPGGVFGRPMSPIESTWAMCVHQCYAKQGTCSDNLAYRCGDSFVDASVPLQDCVLACPEPSALCPNDASVVMHECDGIPDCPFGVDEQGCDPNLFFTCQGAERIPWYKVCDLLPDCSGNQDEQGCFLCDGDRELPPYRVCDGILDCADQTDETQSCAVVQCVLLD